MTYDVFLSHASEDKQQVAVPLAAYLEGRGFRVWLDEFELRVGDSLRRSIDKGLSESLFGVVILSPAYFRKVWTQRELDGLVARDNGNRTLILPVWHNLTREEVLRHSPTLADKVAVSTERGLDYVGEQIVRTIARSHSGERSADLPHHGLLDKKKEEELAQLRRQLVSAKSRYDLQKIIYTVEEFLMRYPGDPEARLLSAHAESALNPKPRTLEPRLKTIYQKSGRSYAMLGIILLSIILLLVLRCPGSKPTPNSSFQETRATRQKPEPHPQKVEPSNTEADQQKRPMWFSWRYQIFWCGQAGSEAELIGRDVQSKLEKAGFSRVQLLSGDVVLRNPQRISFTFQGPPKFGTLAMSLRRRRISNRD